MSATIHLKTIATYLKKHLFISLLIIVGSIIALIFIITSGNIRCENGICGLYIGDWHLHDAMWHIALAEVAFKTIPFQHPIYAGAPLTGYNYLLDIFIFFLSKIGISSIFTFFKLLPIIYILLFAIFAIYFALKQNKAPLYVGSLVFFLYFGASMNDLLTIYHHGNIDLGVLRGFPVVLAIQPGFVLTNIQFAFSLVIFLYILTLLQKDISLKQSLLIGTLLFICTGLKFYGGLLLIFMLGLSEIITTFKKKVWSTFFIKMFLYFLLFGISVILFYNPFVHSGTPGPIFSFSPFAMLHTLIEDKSLFYSYNLSLARYTLMAHGLSPRLIALEAYTLILFLVMNYGTRLVGLIYITKQIIQKKLSKNEVILLAAIIVSTLMPILFVQKGVWFNTMQFLYYGVFFMNFFAAKFLYQLLQSKKLLYVIIAGIIVLATLPSSIEQLRYLYLPQKVIQTQELQALDFLKKQPPGAVFSLPAISDISYVAALSAHPTYFSSTQILDNTGIDYSKRKASLLDPYRLNINKLNVNYFYLLKTDSEYSIYKAKLIKSKRYKKMFENKAVVIYKRI